jgi:hypothetical protein
LQQTERSNDGRSFKLRGLLLEANEAVHQPHIGLASDRCLPSTRASPGNTERIQAVGEQAVDVVTVIREDVPAVSSNPVPFAVSGDDSAAVSIDQAAKEGMTLALDYLRLPVIEGDATR